MFKYLDKNFTKKNIYLLAFILVVILWGLSFVLSESASEKIKLTIFNPFWPLLLLLMDTILAEKQEEENVKNRTLIAKMKVLLTDRKTNHDRKYLLTVVDGREDELSVSEVDNFINDALERDNPIK